jgi:hypothetical protein
MQIHGEPDFSSLKILARELKSNGCEVYSNLGGAAHGHLVGLVLTTAAQYATISAIPFNVPTDFPDPLVIPTGSTRIISSAMERDYEEEVHTFLSKVNGVTNTLKQQIIELWQQANIAHQVIKGIEYLLPNTEEAQPVVIDPDDEQALSAQQGSDLLPSLLQTMTSMQNMMLTMQNDMSLHWSQFCFLCCFLWCHQVVGMIVCHLCFPSGFPVLLEAWKMINSKSTNRRLFNPEGHNTTPDRAKWHLISISK